MKISDMIEQWEPEAKETNRKEQKSLYGWLGTADFSQSQKIRSGLFMQRLLSWLITVAPNNNTELLGDDTMVEVSGHKQKKADLLSRITRIIHYREVKTNINLDSEKKEANLSKIAEVDAALKRQYGRNNVVSKMLCPINLESSGDIEGLNDFAVLYGFEPMNEQEMEQCGLAVGEKIREAVEE